MAQMRILQIHKHDYPSSGGAIVMLRLHHGLKKAGFDSKILSAVKKLETDDSIAIPRSRRLESRLKKVTSRLGLDDVHCVSSFKIRENGAYLDADILHIHGIHGGFFSYLALPSLTESKPAVFTLHDMWAFTGHCVISYDCDRWKTGCGKCPYPNATPAIQRYNTQLEWKLKDWIYSRSKLTIVTLSKKQTEQAKQSMLKRFPIHWIPNGVDCQVYRPLDSKLCRALLGIPPRSKVLMFASMGLHYFSKGGDLLLKALQSLPRSLKAETVLLLLGHRGEAIAEAADLETFNLGYVSSDRLKAIFYSAADLFVHPTRADTLPLVLQESMACGTPMVSFDVGGVPDLVRPGITGYLAEPENAKDLRDGIVQLLEDEPQRSYMSQQCREIALKEYTLELQVQQHIELYRQLV
jgi:glycosyltransferase involved in cell wall biosynthesis